MQDFLSKDDIDFPGTSILVSPRSVLVSTSTSTSQSDLSQFPSVGWKTLQADRTSCPEFSLATILSLFLDSKQADGQPNANFKAVVGDNKAIRLFQAGYVSKLRFLRDKDKVYFAGQCQPEMRSATDYQIRFIVRSTPGVGNAAASVDKFLFSHCSCPAGKGPSATCKHIAAVLFALEEFCRLGLVKDTITCTERLQQWNRPRSKKYAPMKVSEMDFRKCSLGKQMMESSDRQGRPKHSSAELTDPRPCSKRGKVQQRIDELLEKEIAHGRMNCLALAAGSNAQARLAQQQRLFRAQEQKMHWQQQHGCVKQQIDLTDTETDSDYSEASNESSTTCHLSVRDTKEPMSILQPPSSAEEFYQRFVAVTQEQAEMIERDTRSQSECAKWYEQRQLCVTATMCKEIVCRRKSDVSCLVQKKLQRNFFGNTATCYGLDHEAEALAEYVALQQQSDPDYSVQASGLVISCDVPYLACSPDGIVSTSSGQGLVEVKCPYRCRSADLYQVTRDQQSFFLELIDGKLSLKRGHKYYYQVQMSLMVLDLEWADFVVWSPHDLFIERICRNNDFLIPALPKLERFYKDHLLPALFAASQPAPSVRVVHDRALHCWFFSKEHSQSTIDDRNGSSACTVIAAHVAYKVLAGALEEVCPSLPLPRSVTASFIDCMRNGNRIYDDANLGGQLLGVYDALHLLQHTGLIVAPRGDIGCRSVEDLSSNLHKLTLQAEEEGRRLAGLLVQTPFTVALSISAVRVISVFDSHRHGIDDGALIACATCNTAEDSKDVAAFISTLVGNIKDCHLCLLWLRTFS